MSALVSRPKVVVAGLGGAYRGDDAVGPLVAALAVAQARTAVDVGPIEDPMDLLTSWDDADLAVVVDAVRADGAIGRVSSYELGNGDATLTRGPSTSTHGLGLTGVLRLARAVGRSPRRVVLVAVQGEDFSLGRGLSVAVAAAVPEAVRRVVELIEEVGGCA